MISTVSLYQIFSLVLQLLGILAALFLGAVALFREQLNAKFRPPILKITASEMKGAISNHEEGLFMYYHLDVLNERSTSVAKECKVVLVAFQKQEVNGNWKEQTLVVPPYFYWAPMDKPDNPLIDIYDYKRFDFLILKQGSNHIGLRLNRPFHLIDWNIYANSRMRYVLQVEAKNGRSKCHIFEVAWDGQWTYSNLSSISIKEVTS